MINIYNKIELYLTLHSIYFNLCAKSFGWFNWFYSFS